MKGRGGAQWRRRIRNGAIDIDVTIMLDRWLFIVFKTWTKQIGSTIVTLIDLQLEGNGKTRTKTSSSEQVIQENEDDHQNKLVMMMMS